MTSPAPADGTAAPAVEATIVADGIFRIPIPIPIRELGFVNCYALDDGDGLTLVDAGFGDEPTRTLWRDLLGRRPLAGKPLRRIVVTHYHPDHYGAAGRLSRETGAPIFMLPQGHDLARWLAGLDPREAADSAAAHYRRCGFGEAEAAEMAKAGRGLSRAYPDLTDGVEALDPAEAFVAAGTAWRVIETAGHSPFHACLWSPERGVLLAGDQVLQKISPNVGVAWWNPTLDGVGAFLAANERLAATVGDPFVLPGHFEPFRDISVRIGEIAAQHQERLAAAAAVVAAGPRPVRAFLPFLFRRELTGFHLLLAVGEALSHLNHLVATGRLVRFEDEAGRWMFEAA